MHGGELVQHSGDGGLLQGAVLVERQVPVRPDRDRGVDTISAARS
jgi:hypothetical protein